jgi:vacuolar-type H+-ATPase catalytic subunit A/Vma1
MKAYKVTRTMTQEFISFGKNKEEAINNSYNYDYMNLSFLATDSMAQGEVVGGSSKAQVINDVVIIKQRGSDYRDYIRDIEELIEKGANILIEDWEGNLKTLETFRKENNICFTKE